MVAVADDRSDWVLTSFSLFSFVNFIVVVVVIVVGTSWMFSFSFTVSVMFLLGLYLKFQ